MRKFTTWLLIFVLFINLIPTFSSIVKASHATWYVSPMGNDSNTGDILHPFKTLQKAINVSGVSDTIYLRQGIYNSVYPATQGWSLKQSGTANAWFTLSGYPGELAILNGAGYSLARGYSLLNVGIPFRTHLHHVRITNLYIENAMGSYNSNYAIAGEAYANAEGCNSYIRIDNITINNCNNGGIRYWNEEIKSPWINNVTIENCTINNTAYRSGYMGETITFLGCKNFICKDNIVTITPKAMITAANDSHNGLITRNICDSTGSIKAAHGIYLDGSQSSYPAAYVEDVTISNNLIIDTSDSALCLGAEFTGGLNNIDVFNNIIVHSSNTGIRLQQSKGYKQMFDGITLKYNTIYTSNSGYPLWIANYRTKLKNINIANNIFEGDNHNVYQIYAPLVNTTDSCFHFSHNLYDHVSATANTRWQDGTHKFEQTAVIASPIFVNRKTGDFHLNSTSPAIDAADSTYTVSADYDNQTRPQNRFYDIGAYEYGTTTQPNITNVRISPELQQITGYLNISCTIQDNGVSIDKAWIQITYPDFTTKNFSIKQDCYFNQTYPQTGIYHFFIYVRNTKGESSISEEYMFQIIPKLRSAFLIGMINEDYQVSTHLISIKPTSILYLEFHPFSINVITYQEKIFVSKQYIGFIGTKIIIGLFNVAVVSENNFNYSPTHRNLIHLS